MVDLTLEGDYLVVRMRGLGKLLALKRRVRVPLACVVDARVERGAVSGLWKGWRIPGTHIPGVIVAGTYYRDGGKAFWFARHGRDALVIDLRNAAYDQIVVETRDAEGMLNALNTAARGTRPDR